LRNKKKRKLRRNIYKRGFKRRKKINKIVEWEKKERRKSEVRKWQMIFFGFNKARIFVFVVAAA